MLLCKLLHRRSVSTVFVLPISAGLFLTFGAHSALADGAVQDSGVKTRAISSQQPRDISLKDVVISMKQENHTASFGRGIPVYSVSIAGDGTVNYEGISEVQVRGKYAYSIPVERVRELVEEFHRIDFFSLEDEYVSKKLDNGLFEIVDHAVPITVSITIGGKTKRVYDFYSAPEALKELERKIYDLSEVCPYAAPKKALEPRGN